MYTVQEMRWNESLQMFEYTSFIQVCKTKKAKDKYIDEILNYNDGTEYVSNVKTILSGGEVLTEYISHWTKSDGTKMQQKYRLLVKEALVRS